MRDGLTGMDAASTARAALVDHLVATGAVASERVAAALRAVPRHLFVPELPVADAYADRSIGIRTDERGRTVSSLSQPTMVAEMLELAAVRTGDRVLEVGTATGYDAALLRALVGADGAVVSIEIDAELADRARANLAAAGVGVVRVIAGDGKAPVTGEAPFDRVVVTAGAPEVAPAWPDQLVTGGRLVVPLVDARGIGAVVLFEKDEDGLTRRAERPCAFVPLR